MPNIISPIDGQVTHSYEHLSVTAALERVARARVAQRAWQGVPIEDRVRLCQAMITAYGERLDANAEAITRMMGKPLGQARGEYSGGFTERTRHLCSIAAHALRDLEVSDGASDGIRRFIRRDPVGVVFVIAAWNYPLLIPTGPMISALLAGNAVVLKHAHQTAAVAEQIARAFADAGAPEGLVQAMPVDHATAAAVAQSRDIGYVSFTGSVRGGHEVYRAVAQERFIGVGLELGGKDPALVLPDTPIEKTAATLIDGGFYNAGQSCCAIERIYVHAEVHDAFVEACVAEIHKYVVGDPLAKGTTIGPLVNEAAAAHVRAQAEQALAAGARQVSDDARFTVPDRSPCYLPPRLFTEVRGDMGLMREESFGPILGIAKVSGVDEAIARMNDSDYGLTASVWTADADRGLAVAERLEAGTVFQNRCDYLDPSLAWTGVKDTGFGCSLSELGFHSVTRPKSYHLRTRF